MIQAPTLKCTECNLKSKVVSNLSAEELSHMADHCVIRYVGQHEKVMVESLPATHILYLRAGLAKVHKSGPYGKDQILKIADKGSFLGLQNVINPTLHQYSVTTLMNSEICFLAISVFKDFVQNNGEFAMELVNYISQEETNHFERFINLQQKQINGRLADALLHFSDQIFQKDEFTLPLTKQELAELTGSTRESVTRCLKTFRESKLLTTNKNKYNLIDKKRLENIALYG